MTDFLHTDARWTEHFVEVSDPHKEGHHVRFYFDMAQPEQEPVAYLSNKRQRINIEIKPQTFVDIPTVTDWEMPLYMKPPQRTWVWLTDEEIQDCLKGLPTQTIDVYARRIEAKLKEKNNGNS